MGRHESSHKWRGRIAAAAVGGLLATVPTIIERSTGDHSTEVRPEKQQLTYEAVRELGYLQLLQRDMKGNFTLVARDHYKLLDLPGKRFDVHYDPSPELIGQKKDFSADGQSFTVIDFKKIQINRRQVMKDGKMVEEVEAILPPVTIGDSKVTMLDDQKMPENGWVDKFTYRLNVGDKIKGKDMFGLAERDFRKKALEDEILKKASEAYAKQIIADFEAKHGFKFVNVRFADPNLPSLQVAEVQLSDGVEIQRRLVDPDGTPRAFRSIEDIIAETNARIEANKARNGGKYVDERPTADRLALAGARAD